MALESGKFYEDGNEGFYVFTKDDKNTYTSPVHINGMVSFEGSFERSVDNKAAEDQIDYIKRVSPARMTGTVTIIGLRKSDYVALYGTQVKDKNGVVGFGGTDEPMRTGVVFFNRGHVIVNNKDTVVEQAHCLYNVTFDLPPLSTKTIEEDNTDIREFSIGFTAEPILVNGGYHTYYYVTSEDKYNASEDKIWDSHFANHTADEGNITMYIPDETKPE